MGALGVVYFRRDSSFSVLGRTYDTLMPRYWQTVTFIWDLFPEHAGVHALLDPGVMRKYLEHWMCTDTHKHFGTEYLTGGPVGNWYSVNDFAMVSMVREYTRWTGDVDWLETPVAGTKKRGHRFSERLCPTMESISECEQAGRLRRNQQPA